MTYTKTIKPALLVTAAILFAAPLANAETPPSSVSNTETAMSGTPQTEMSVLSEFENKDPSLIKQNIGDLDSTATVTGAIEDANTTGNFERVLEKTNHDETLMNGNNYTVFVPRDSAFWQVEGQQYVEWMTSPEASNLEQVVKTHIVEGELLSTSIANQIEASADGKVSLETVGGDMLTIWMEDGYVQVSDEIGNIGQVTTADIEQSNGVIHVINTVLEPAM